MNPFELSGPLFLQFYFAFGLLVLGGLWLALQSFEGGVPPRTPLSDPYLMAFLRGGSREALRTAILVLIDRQLLQVDDDGTLSVGEKNAGTRTANAFERRILDVLSTPAHASGAIKHDGLLMTADGLYRKELARLGLVPDEGTRMRRLLLLTVALVALTAVAGVKVLIGLSRGRPVEFLVLEALAFGAAAIFVTQKSRTVLGDRFLADLRELFRGLRDRALELRPHASTSDLALVTALFGASHLSRTSYPHAGMLVPRADSSVGSTCGSGSSCGSSCGGGCGGGCGGCGS